MQGAEYQVAGFRRRHCHRDGFSVTQFTDENDVGVLAHCRTNAVGKARQVSSQLALYDLALPTGMYDV